MDDLLLVVDIGNTNTVLGIYRDGNLIIHWRLSTSITRTEDESWIVVKMLCESAAIPAEHITGVIISSVVPNATRIFQRMIENYLYFRPVVVSADLDLGIKIDYEDPRAVGADRLCNAVAGFEKYGGPLIIVDFGTATTFDVVSEQGDYLGGVIAPGIETSAADLWRRAARLFRVELKFPDQILGKNTETSMQAGIMFGTVEMVDGLVRRLRDSLKYEKCRVIATGGLANTIVEKSQTIDKVDPYLTLDGLRIIYERLRKLENEK
jgi:type III pantothenate kinase